MIEILFEWDSFKVTGGVGVGGPSVSGCNVTSVQMPFIKIRQLWGCLSLIMAIFKPGMVVLRLNPGPGLESTSAIQNMTDASQSLNCASEIQTHSLNIELILIV